MTLSRVELTGKSLVVTALQFKIIGLVKMTNLINSI